mmetsp:Transcript_53050/g.152918  ORF Transcript_53050/g.152918 Transcript_53050/m.152918 type:complete len:200 (-) Transcript_53050:1421-2020(-)
MNCKSKPEADSSFSEGTGRAHAPFSVWMAWVFSRNVAGAAAPFSGWTVSDPTGTTCVVHLDAVAISMAPRYTDTTSAQALWASPGRHINWPSLTLKYWLCATPPISHWKVFSLAPTFTLSRHCRKFQFMMPLQQGLPFLETSRLPRCQICISGAGPPPGPPPHGANCTGKASPFCRCKQSPVFFSRIWKISSGIKPEST